MSQAPCGRARSRACWGPAVQVSPRVHQICEPDTLFRTIITCTVVCAVVGGRAGARRWGPAVQVRRNAWPPCLITLHSVGRVSHSVGRVAHSVGRVGHWEFKQLGGSEGRKKILLWQFTLFEIYTCTYATLRSSGPPNYVDLPTLLITPHSVAACGGPFTRHPPKHAPRAICEGSITRGSAVCRQDDASCSYVI
jgi:hypothetical protein